MRCYSCGAQLTEKHFCTNCGADVSRYKKLISFSNYYYNQGLEKAGVRDLSGAIESLKLCLKINKFHIEARNLLGLSYFEMGETVAALSEWVISKNLKPKKNIADDYIDIIQRSPSQQEAFNQNSRKYNRALNYCHNNSKDLAVIQLKKVLSDNPNFVRAHLLLALLHMDAREWDKARRELNRSLRIDRGNTTAMRYMKEVEAALKQDESARTARHPQKEEVIKYQSGNETIIQPVNGLEPKKNTGWIWALFAGLAVGVAVSWFLILPARVLNAKADLNDQLVSIGEEIDKKNADIAGLTQQVETLTRENADLSSQAEALAGKDGQMTTAEALMNAAWLYIQNPADTEKLSEAIDRIDREAMESGDISASVRNLYTTLLENTGTDLAKSYYDAGYKAYRAKDYETAIENLKKAVTYDAKNAEALFALGNAYKEKGNKKLAVETYEQVIELFPNTEKARQSQRYINQLEE